MATNQQEPPKSWGKLIPLLPNLRIINLCEPFTKIGTSTNIFNYSGGGSDFEPLQFSIHKKPEHFSVYIRDCSDNGTFLNGTLLEKDIFLMIFGGDRISIGPNCLDVFVFQVIIEPDYHTVPLLPCVLRNDYVSGATIENQKFNVTKFLFDKMTFSPHVLKKVPSFQNSNRNAEVLRKFESVENPFLVKFENVIIDRKVFFLVSKFCRSGHLQFFINSPFNETHFKFIFCQMTSAILYLHQKLRLHHGRLKPENVLIYTKDDNFLVKITDYGLPAFPDNKSLYCPFVAPEHCFIDTRSRFASDVWSLGEILYLMLFKTIPFNGDVMSKTSGYNIMCLYGNGDFKNDSVHNLLKKMLRPKWQKRIDMQSVWSHLWLQKDEEVIKMTKELEQDLLP